MTFNDLSFFKHITPIETDRLLLRRMTTSDYQDVYEYSRDPEVPRYLLWYPHVSVLDSKQYLKTVDRLYKKCAFYDWGITLKGSGKLIGTVGFTSFDIRNNSGEIGYVLNRAYWRQGIATEAVREIINYGFTVLDLNRLEAKYMPENIGSERLLLKLGFKKEGVRRGAIYAKGRYCDVAIASLLKSEYCK